MTKKQQYGIFFIALLLLGGVLFASAGKLVDLYFSMTSSTEQLVISEKPKDVQPTVTALKPLFPIPQEGFSRFYQKKYGITFVYPQIGYGLCFNDMTCTQADISNGFSYVSVVPNSATKKDEEYLVNIRPIGISAGLDASDFANLMNKTNQEAGYAKQGTEQTVLLKEGLGYMFDVTGGYAWNGYESNGEEIYFVSGKANSFTTFPGKTRTVLIFSQNNYLYEVLFEKGNSIAEAIVSSIQFERQE